MKLNWLTKKLPTGVEFRAGAKVDDKFVDLNTSELHETLVEVWTHFTTNVISLYQRSEWDVIQCSLRLDSGNIVLSLAEIGGVKGQSRGKSYFFCGNFIKEWHELAQLDDGGEAIAFRNALNKLHAHYANVITKAATEYMSLNEKQLVGTTIEFICRNASISKTIEFAPKSIPFLRGGSKQTDRPSVD